MAPQWRSTPEPAHTQGFDQSHRNEVLLASQTRGPAGERGTTSAPASSGLGKTGQRTRLRLPRRRQRGGSLHGCGKRCRSLLAVLVSALHLGQRSTARVRRRNFCAALAGGRSRPPLLTRNTKSHTSIHQVRESHRHAQAVRPPREVPLVDVGGPKILDLVKSRGHEHPVQSARVEE